MRVEIKQLEVVEGRPRWMGLPATELLGKSVVDYMLSTDKQTIAALYEDDKPLAFVSNHDKLVELYKAKGLSVHAKQMKDFIGTTLIPPVVAYTFEGAEVVEIKPVEERQD